MPLADTGLRWQTDALRQTPTGDLRTIVIFGDSIVYGWGVRYEESYPALVETWLNQAVGAPRWRVINAGVPGNTVLMGASRYERDVDPFRPEIVVLGFGLNDSALRRTRFDAQREELWRAQYRLWDRLLYYPRRFSRVLARHLASQDDGQAEVPREERPRVEVRWFVEALSQLVRRAQCSGAQVLLAPLAPVACASLVAVAQTRLSPAQWQVYVRYQELIARIARAEGARLVPLALEPRGPSAEHVLAPDGVHLTLAGQRWLATQVYAQLEGNIPSHDLSTPEDA
jgi:lysophospholipase L1-like esterase